MCTVTYIPLKRSVLFSICRDENPTRTAAAMPSPKKGANRYMIYPADGLAGGTWVGVNSAGDVLILLNGGFTNHERKETYRLSRGLIVKALLDSMSPVAQWKEMDLTDIEPFTLIVYSNQKLYRLTWTGTEKMHSMPDPLEAHIWSSATLYKPAIQKKRQQWFQSFLQQYPSLTSKQLTQYLLHDAPADSENGFIMNRNEAIKTCSASFIERKQEHAVVQYHDLLSHIAEEHHFFFEATASSIDSSVPDRDEEPLSALI